MSITNYCCPHCGDLEIDFGQTENRDYVFVFCINTTCYTRGPLIRWEELKDWEPNYPPENQTDEVKQLLINKTWNVRSI